MSTGDRGHGLSTEEQVRHPSFAHTSLVSVSSPDVIWAYEEAMSLQDQPGVVQALGVSRTDVFYDESFLADAKARFKQNMPMSKGRRVILYAPTYRGENNAAIGPDKLDIRMMREAFHGDSVLIVKHHPFVRNPPSIPEDCADFAFVAPPALSISDLMISADICITDYSSLIFEYSLFDRPIVFFAFDIDDYLDERGFYYSYEDMTPGPICKKTEEIVDYIAHVDDCFDREEIKRFRKRFMASCDGHSTDRILERAMNL